MSRLAFSSWKPRSISCPSIAWIDGGLNKGLSWWNCGVDMRNERGWNTLWLALNWTGSCYKGMERDVNKTWSSTLSGRSGGSLVTLVSCCWMAERVPRKATIVDEFEGELFERRLNLEKTIGNTRMYFGWRRLDF